MALVLLTHPSHMVCRSDEYEVILTLLAN